MKRRFVDKVLPPSSSRRILVGKIKRKIDPRSTPANQKGKLTYDDWIRDVEPLVFKDTDAQLKRVNVRPLISIVVPCYNTPEKYLVPLVDSVLAQHYDNFELCLVDGSTETSANERIAEQAKRDKRISYIKVGKNLGIVGNTNIGLEKA